MIAIEAWTHACATPPSLGHWRSHRQSHSCNCGCGWLPIPSPCTTPRACLPSHRFAGPVAEPMGAFVAEPRERGVTLDGALHRRQGGALPSLRVGSRGGGRHVCSGSIHLHALALQACAGEGGWGGERAPRVAWIGPTQLCRLTKGRLRPSPLQGSLAAGCRACAGVSSVQRQRQLVVVHIGMGSMDQVRWPRWLSSRGNAGRGRMGMH